MESKEFTDFAELEKFIQPLIDEKKWAIDIRQNTNTGVYKACWIEHKNYTSHDGGTYPDEIWTTIDGQMKCVQDLEPEHAKNVLRLLLRQEREQRQIIQAALQSIGDRMRNEEDDEGSPEFMQPVPQHLH